MSCWIRCICSESASSPLVEQAIELLNRRQRKEEDADNLLALLSNPTFLRDDNDQALALLVYPGILPCLIDHPDKYVQYTVFCVLKRVLLDTLVTNDPTSARLNCPHRSDIIRVLVQGLENSSTTISQSRATLELIHDILKHNRQMIRRLDQNAGRQPVQSLEVEASKLLPVSILLIRELASSSGLWIKLTERMLEVQELQRSTIVVMIDLFKSLQHSPSPTPSPSSSSSDTWISRLYNSAADVCRIRVLDCLEQLLRVDAFDAMVHKKLLELMTMIVKSRSRAIQQPTIVAPLPSQPLALPTAATCSSSSSSSNNNSNSTNPFFQDLKIILPILETFSPIAQQILEILQDKDPFLERLSVRGTTFVSFPDQSFQQQGVVQSCLSNPEVFGQLGRVFVEAALAILESLSGQWKKGAPFGSSFLKSTENGDTRVTTTFLDGFEKVRNGIRDWVGPRTLFIFLSLYGQDDAGVSWGLKSLTVLHQRLRSVLREIRSILWIEKVGSSSLQGKNRLCGTLAPSLEQGPSRTPILVHAQQDPPSSTDHKNLLRLEKWVSDIYSHLAWHAHPIEALISFLETIGYDAETLLDLLLTVDDRETGGMLGAVMAVLRDFTEDEQAQQERRTHWVRGIDQEEDEDEDKDDGDIGKEEEEEGVSIAETTAGGSGSGTTRRRLFDTEYCLVQVTDQIARLNEKNLFPYNPTPLLVVLARTMQVLQTVIGSEES